MAKTVIQYLVDLATSKPRKVLILPPPFIEHRRRTNQAALRFFSFRPYPSAGIAAVLQWGNQTVQHSFPRKNLTEVCYLQNKTFHISKKQKGRDFPIEEVGKVVHGLLLIAFRYLSVLTEKTAGMRAALPPVQRKRESVNEQPNKFSASMLWKKNIEISKQKHQQRTKQGWIVDYSIHTFCQRE